jgi:cytochrome c1
MRRLFLLAVLVPSMAGCGWSSFFLGGQQRSSVVYPTAPKNPVPRWINVEHLPKRAYRGAVLFDTTGCTACHTYAGSGSKNLGAPDLTAIGVHHLAIRFEISHLKCPSCVNPGSPMPSFRSLSKKHLHQLAVFLEASKGRH